MFKLGTNYGGWIIPINNELNDESIIYSVGVGEDISFDLQLQSKYNSTIILIDPTIRAKIHYDEINNYYNTKKWEFSGNIQKDYKKNINNLNVNLSKLQYLNIGIWKEKNKLKFYKNKNPSNVSQSLISNIYSNNYDLVDVDSLKNIMKSNNHNKIDLLKIDIEGAEIDVLNNILDDNIFPTYLCVEFDLYLKKKDYDGNTKKIIDRLISNNYKIIYNDNMNITFKH